MHLDSMYSMGIFPDSYLSALWPQFWEAFRHAGRVHAMWLDWQMSRELLKHATKKKVDFQRIFSLFNLEKKLWSLFSASLMKSVFYIKGSLLRRYQLQDQPQLSSVNDHQLAFPLRDEASSSVLFRGSRHQTLVWVWHSRACQMGEILLEFGFDFFSKSLSHLACLLHVIQSSVFQPFSIGKSFWGSVSTFGV